MSTERSAPKIFLFRHGETEWSLAGQHTSRTDVPLTQRGEQSAGRVGQRLRGFSFTQVFTSPRLRARRTCELMDLDTEAKIDPKLAEWDYGDYEGHRTDEILREQPGWNLFVDGCPNGESPAEVCARADAIIDGLTPLTGNTALFSHGHIGRMIAARWIGLEAAQAQRLVLNPASMSILGYERDERVLMLWNADARALASSHLPLGDLRPMKQRALERWEGEGGEIPSS
jgi:probable phosphoglycerate mutase